jgi:hypothetical protein
LQPIRQEAIMASDDATRRQLYALLERDTSPETAALLMDHIPPGVWPDFATKGDIARLDARFGQVDARFQQVDARFRQVDARFEQVDARFEQVDARFDRVEMKLDSMSDRLLATLHQELGAHSKHFIYGSIGVVLATASVVLAAARLG